MQAARFHEACLRDTLGWCAVLAASLESAPPTVFLARRPPSASRLDPLPTSVTIAPQGGGGLGVRIARALAALLGRGADGAILLGTDSPDLPARIVLGAARALARHDLVLAPAHDGGFTLIGVSARSFRRPRASLQKLLRPVPWSAAETLGETLRAVEAANLSAACVESWWDIDDERDLRLLGSRLRAPRSLGAGRAPRVAEWLEGWSGGPKARRRG